MTWRPAREANEDTDAHCFFESFIEGKSFITPGRTIV